MNDRQRQQLVEQCEEAELSLLMYDYAMEDGKRLAKEFDEAQANGLLPEIPEELDHKCRALIDSTFAKMERKTRLQRIVRSAAKAAVILLVVLGVMTTTVMSVEALRVPVINFFFACRDRYSVASFDGNKHDELYADDVTTVLESIIPSNYALVTSEIGEDGTGVIIYEGTAGDVISLNIYWPTGELSFDTENVIQHEVNLVGYDALLIHKNGYRIMWYNPDRNLMYLFYADGLSYEDFWIISCSIAENC